MNHLILLSGSLCLLTALLHIFLGHQDPIKPFMKSEYPKDSKAMFLASWHMVSITLVTTTVFNLYIGWFDNHDLYGIVVFSSILNVGFGLILLFAGWYYYGAKTMNKLPQWILLLSIGLLGLIGTIT